MSELGGAGHEPITTVAKRVIVYVWQPAKYMQYREAKEIKANREGNPDPGAARKSRLGYASIVLAEHRSARTRVGRWIEFDGLTMTIWEIR